MEETRTTAPAPGRRMQIVSIVIIILLIAETIGLILQNRELKAEITKILAGNPVEQLQAGDKVDTFTATSLNGKPAPVGFSDPSKQYLLFIFSTTCPYCEKNFPLWKSIAEQAPQQCEITGVSVHSAEKTFEYIARHEANFQSVVVAGDTGFARKYKISGVPQTILIGGNGIVKKNWNGALSPEQVKELQVLIHGTNVPVN